MRTSSSWSAKYSLPKLPSPLCSLRSKRFCNSTMAIYSKLIWGVLLKARTSSPWTISCLHNKERCLWRWRVVSTRSSAASCSGSRSWAWWSTSKITPSSIHLSNLPKCMNSTSRRSRSMLFPLRSVLCPSTILSYRRSFKTNRCTMNSSGTKLQCYRMRSWPTLSSCGAMRRSRGHKSSQLRRTSSY